MIKAAAKIALLSQEFDVVGSRTLRGEFLSVFEQQMAISARIEKVQVGPLAYTIPRCIWIAKSDWHRHPARYSLSSSDLEIFHLAEALHLGPEIDTLFSQDTHVHM